MSIITLKVLGVDKVFLGGDVALGPQSADNALVVGLQGIPVSNAQPNNSDVLTYDSGAGEWRPEPGGGGAVAEPLFQIVYGTGPSVSSSDHAIYDFNVFQQTNSIQNINQTNVWPGTGDPGTNTVALVLANTSNSSVGQPIQYSPNLLFLSHYRRTANSADAIWRTGWQLQPEVNDNAFLSLFGSQNSHLPIRQIDIEMDGLLGATTMTVYGNQDISTATAPFVGLCLANTGATGAGELFQQRSPMFRLQGHQFNGSAQISAASLQVRPFSGTSNFSLDFYNSTAGVNGLLMGWFPQTPALGNGTTGFASAALQDISIEAGSLTNDGSVLPNGWYANHLGNSNNAGLVAAMLSSQKEFQFRASALQDGTTPIAMVPRVDSTYWLGANGLSWNSVFSAWYDTKEGAQLTAAATITPTSGLHHITGATHVTTIATTNVPLNGNVSLVLIADSAINIDTGGNVATAVAMTTGQSVQLVYDSNASTWYVEGVGGGSGTVTSIGIGSGLASTQTPLTTTGTLSIATGGVTAAMLAAGAAASNLGSAGGALTGTYPNPTIATGATITTPVMATGCTASGAGAFDFSGSTATWKFPTGGVSADIPASGAHNVGSGASAFGTVFCAGLRGANSTNLSYSGQGSNVADPIGNAAGFHGFSSGPTQSAAGMAMLTTSGATNQTSLVVTSGSAVYAGLYSRQMTCDAGGTTIRKVVVFSGNFLVQTAAATANLTTIAGVALGTRTNGQSVNVMRLGPCLISADAGIVAGDLLVTSDAVAGNVKTNNSAVAGTIVGRAMESTGNTLAGAVFADLMCC